MQFANPLNFTENQLTNDHTELNMKKTIDPAEWNQFLSEFSARNRGRRARFEIFGGGGVSEEQQEGRFEAADLNGRTASVTRSYEDHGEQRSMVDEIHDIHGIEVQLDAEGGEDTIGFSNHNGETTVLHFESLIDGDS